MDDPLAQDTLGFMLLCAFAVVLILFLHDTASRPVASVQKTAKKASRYAPCGNPTPLREGEPLDYDDVDEAEHELCNTSYFPYCHTLSLPFYNPVADDLLEQNWTEYSCERDVVPDAACMVVMPLAEWTRGPFTYIENDRGCVEP